MPKKTAPKEPVQEVLPPEQKAAESKVIGGQQVVVDPENPFGCTPRELGFARDLVNTSDPHKAVINNYDAKPRSVRQIAWELQRRPRVASQIAHLMQQKLTVVSSGPVELVNLLYSIARANMVDAFTLGKDGTVTLKTLQDMPEDVKRAIKSITVVGTGAVKVELYDKIRAAELLGRYHSLWSGADGSIVPRAPGREATPEPAPVQAKTYEEILGDVGGTLAQKVTKTVTETAVKVNGRGH